MDEMRFQRINRAFEANGGVIASGPEIDRHLEKFKAEASTIDEKTILIKSGIPTASAMFEELIHTAQIRSGRATGVNMVEMEIEAKRKLVRHQKLYGIPDHENEVTIKHIRELEQILRGGAAE